MIMRFQAWRANYAEPWREIKGIRLRDGGLGAAEEEQRRPEQRDEEPVFGVRPHAGAGVTV